MLYTSGHSEQLFISLVCLECPLVVGTALPSLPAVNRVRPVVYYTRAPLTGDSWVALLCFPYKGVPEHSVKLVVNILSGSSVQLSSGATILYLLSKASFQAACRTCYHCCLWDDSSECACLQDFLSSGIARY